jgi:hypothetical protein
VSPGFRLLAAALVACAASIVGAAGTNPRDAKLDVTYVIPRPVTERGEIGAWLLRLGDRYRVEGAGNVMGRIVTVKGAVDCTAIGAGPGMQCILNISWNDQFEIITDPGQGPVGVFNLPGGVAYLNPSMMLTGLDPGRQGITFLLVDNKGLPEGGPGVIAGDRATLRAPCVNAPALFLAMNPDARFAERRPDTCERIIRIDARPGSTVVHMATDIEINGDVATRFDLTLRREPPGGVPRKR